MWAFRKEIHKLSSVGLVTPILCGEQVTFNGTQGIFLVDIVLGTETGVVTLNHEAFGVPDRFQITYDGGLDADSLYVGGSLTGNPPDYGGLVGGTFNNVPEYFWDGSQFVASGDTQNISVVQGDVAVFGETDGTGTINLFKTTTTPITMQVQVTAPLSGTAWTFSTLCPTQAVVANIVQNDFQEEGDTLCVSCATITVEVPSPKDVNDSSTDINIVTNEVTLGGHGFGTGGEIVNLIYTTTGTEITGLADGTAYQCQIVDALSFIILNVTLTGTGTDIHTFTPIGTNKRVEIVKSGDVPTYTFGASLCSGTATPVIGNITETITTTKEYRFGIGGIKEAGLDNFSSTITVEVYDNDTNVLEDTYTLTRTHNNTSC